MSDEDFATSQETQKLSDEVACLKMMITLILKGMGQADAGKVIINMERYVKTLGDMPQNLYLPRAEIIWIGDTRLRYQGYVGLERLGKLPCALGKGLHAEFEQERTCLLH